MSILSLRKEISKIEAREGIFPISGVVCYSGRQGSGKTYSICDLIDRLNNLGIDYWVVSNLHISNHDYIEFKYYSELMYACQNFRKPLIVIIDEAHILFNSLESKKMPISIFETISQNRKAGRIIALTSQVFDRLAKPMREQVTWLISCNHYNFLGFHLQFNSCFKDIAYDEATKKYDYTKKKLTFGFLDKKKVLRYDTLQFILYDDDFFDKEVREDFKNEIDKINRKNDVEQEENVDTIDNISYINQDYGELNV